MRRGSEAIGIARKNAVLNGRLFRRTSRKCAGVPWAGAALATAFEGEHAVNDAGERGAIAAAENRRKVPMHSAVSFFHKVMMYWLFG